MKVLLSFLSGYAALTSLVIAGICPAWAILAWSFSGLAISALIAEPLFSILFSILGSCVKGLCLCAKGILALVRKRRAKAVQARMADVYSIHSKLAEKQLA